MHITEQTEPRIFGYARIAHQSLVQLYVPDLLPAVQIAYVLGKLLPMNVDLWQSKEPKLPDEIPADWISLTIEPPQEGWESADPALKASLPNRTAGWFQACRVVVHKYHQAHGQGAEEIEVIENIPEGTATEERPDTAAVTG